MARKRTVSVLASIAPAALEHVVGGRISVPTGPDPSVIEGIKSMATAVGELGQKRAAEQASQQQMMGQVMQQMMGRR